MGMTVQVEHPDGHKLLLTSPLTIPHAPVKIEQFTYGQQALPAPEGQAPDLETIIQELRTNALEFAFGYDPQLGQLVKSTLLKSVHIGL